MENTRQSLLERMRGDDPRRAWEQFYETYWAVILNYARKLGLDDASSRDVLQESMVALMRAMPEFRYDPRRGKFRNFLLTIVHRKALAAFRRTARRGEVPLEGSTENEAALPAASDDCWQQSLFEEALRRVQSDPDIEPKTMQVFRAYAIDGVPVADVAREFGLKENAVYQIKNRVIRRLKEEIAGIDGGNR